MNDEYSEHQPDGIKNESEQYSELAATMHSLTFSYTDKKTGKKYTYNTFDDWHLIPTSRPVFSPPGIKKYSLDIPGANGEIDMTTTLTGYPAYQNRTGSIEFLVLHEGLSTSLGESYGYNNSNNVSWQGVYTDILNSIHGKYVKVETEDIADFYYKGIITINDWASDEQYSKITLNYDLEPFKYSITDTTNLWKWDSFSFETDVIKMYDTNHIRYSVNKPTDVLIIGTNTPVIPSIYVTHNTYLATSDGKFSLSPGINTDPLIIIYPGEQIWNFSILTTTDTENTEAKAAVYFRERSL